MTDDSDPLEGLSYRETSAEEARAFIEDELLELDTFEERMKRFADWIQGRNMGAGTFTPLISIVNDEWGDVE